MNVFLHKHIKVYNSDLKKIKQTNKKNIKKKTFYNWAKAPQCNMRKKLFQKSLAPLCRRSCGRAGHTW